MSGADSVDSRMNDFDHEQLGNHNYYDNTEERKGEDYNKGSVQNFELKDDHDRRPVWIAYVCEKNEKSRKLEEFHKLFLEAFSPLQKEATEFLIAIAEPKSRPVHIHEYWLTPSSLHAAASVELKNEDILKVLNKFSKNKIIPIQTQEFIKEHTSRYGKAKIVLERNTRVG